MAGSLRRRAAAGGTVRRAPRVVDAAASTGKLESALPVPLRAHVLEKSQHDIDQLPKTPVRAAPLYVRTRRRLDANSSARLACPRRSCRTLRLSHRVFVLLVLAQVLENDFSTTRTTFCEPTP